MSEEKKKILEMVAEGTITPSEGARLLEALGSSGGFMGHRRRPSGRRPVMEAKAILAEVGPMIQETIGDIFSGKHRAGSELEGLDFQEHEKYSRKIEPGLDLVIHGRMNKGGGLSLKLKGSSEKTLAAAVEDDDDSPVSVVEKDGKIILLWKSGTLSVTVPDCADSVRVVTQGGSISSEKLAMVQKLSTMGGSVTISHPGDSFTAKTMGGSLDIHLDGSWKANSKAKSMGGSIKVALAEGVAVDLSASTLGGTIEAGSMEHEILSSSEARRGGAKMTIRYGDSDDPPTLAVSTMGGDITVQGDEND